MHAHDMDVQPPIRPCTWLPFFSAIAAFVAAMQGANSRDKFLRSLQSQRSAASSASLGEPAHQRPQQQQQQQTHNVSARHSFLQATMGRRQQQRQQSQQSQQQQQQQRQQQHARRGYLKTLQEQRQLQNSSAEPEQIVVSHATVKDAAVPHATVQAAPRKRPRYDNTRRAAKAQARAAARPPKITMQSRRSNADRLRVLLQREVCECPRETCYRQFRVDPEDVIAVVVAFASLPKVARDGLVCRKNAAGGFECVLAGRRMGPRCFARMLCMHHGTLYKKGHRVDRRLRQWMAPRRCPKARLRQAKYHVLHVELCSSMCANHVDLYYTIGIAEISFCGCTSTWARHCPTSSTV